MTGVLSGRTLQDREKREQGQEGFGKHPDHFLIRYVQEWSTLKLEIQPVQGGMDGDADKRRGAAAAVNVGEETKLVHIPSQDPACERNHQHSRYPLAPCNSKATPWIDSFADLHSTVSTVFVRREAQRPETAAGERQATIDPFEMSRLEWSSLC